MKEINEDNILMMVSEGDVHILGAALTVLLARVENDEAKNQINDLLLSNFIEHKERMINDIERLLNAIDRCLE